MLFVSGKRSRLLIISWWWRVNIESVSNSFNEVIIITMYVIFSHWKYFISYFAWIYFKIYTLFDGTFAFSKIEVLYGTQIKGFPSDVYKRERCIHYRKSDCIHTSSITQVFSKLGHRKHFNSVLFSNLVSKYFPLIHLFFLLASMFSLNGSYLTIALKKYKHMGRHHHWVGFYYDILRSMRCGMSIHSIYTMGA